MLLVLLTLFACGSSELPTGLEGSSSPETVLVSVEIPASTVAHLRGIEDAVERLAAEDSQLYHYEVRFQLHKATLGGYYVAVWGWIIAHDHDIKIVNVDFSARSGIVSLRLHDREEGHGIAWVDSAKAGSEVPFSLFHTFAATDEQQRNIQIELEIEIERG